MQKIITPKLVIIVLAFSLLVSCKKEKVSDCYNDLTTIRSLSNVNATVVQQINGDYYIIETGTIDTRLKPCSLPVEFQVNNLQVVITGETKLISSNALEPCCTEVIGKIEKR
jgi:hypothetical protein